IYIALARQGETLVKRVQLFGERARIREIASLHAFDLLRRKLCLV
ncbi:MAG: competence/damage-inducible protein A, partial [Clostridia bacterium]|nr:competence/damage-inducible protein A [Clostridia bacterium]